MNLENIRPFNVGEMRRVGSFNDGGYVVPKVFPSARTVVSFGLGDNWSFEKQLLREGLIDSFLVYDHSVSTRILYSRVKSRASLRNFKITPLLYRIKVLIEYFYDFRLKKNNHVQKKVTKESEDNSSTNLMNIAANLMIKDFVLKVDIEGDEYQIIEQIVGLSSRIPLVIIEFHDTENQRAFFESALFMLAKKYIICHSHANNFETIGSDGIPIAIEITFGRSDIYFGEEKIDCLPREEIDYPCAPQRIDHQIFFK